MKIPQRIITAGSVFIFLIFLLAYFFSQNSKNDLSETERFKDPNKVSKYDRIDLAMEQELEMTKDPALGYIPRERLQTAKTYLESISNMKGAIPGITWTERGPNNVGGRTRAIMIDPNDPLQKTVFAASVAGGLWKTTNFYAANPNWVSIDDFFENIAITTLAYDPSNTNVIYFGTGEGWFNADAVRGNGIWKSTDGGNTWNQLSSTDNSDFHYVLKIAINSSGHIFATTRNAGLQKSTDGGATWIKVLGYNNNGGSTNRAADVEIAANGDIYCSLGIMNTDGIYKSTDGGSSWTKLSSGLPNTSTGYTRIELACAPSNSNVVYAIFNGSNYDAEGIYKTSNGGSSWGSVTNPNSAAGNNFCRGQGWYNLAMAVDPNNANRLIIGGIDLYLSNNSGSSWNQISHWYGGYSLPYVHADQHFIGFAPGSSDTVLFGNDGGIFLSTNSTTSPSFTSKVQDYNVTQFYACAMHPDSLSNHFLAGSQDNGSQKYSVAGMNSTVEVTGGDGGYCHIDQDQPTYQYTSYVFNNFRRSTNGGSSFSSINSSYSGTGRFINPSDYDNVGNKIYSSTDNGKYLRWNDPQSGNNFDQVTVSQFGTGQVSAVTVSPNTTNRVFFGLDNGKVVRVDNAHNNSAAGTLLNGSAGMPGYYISCVEVEDGNDDHILVTYSNYGLPSVWETTNGGTSWTNIEGNMPDIPVRWALFNPNNPDQAMIATELGVWTTDDLDGSNTEWAPSNNGLANVRVDMLQKRSSDKMVIAATHGRGLFSTSAFSSASAIADFTVNKSLAYTGKNIQFTDASSGATSWQWNFGDGTTSTAQNPVKSYSSAGKYNVQLTINNGAATTIKNGVVHILPNKTAPYTIIDGGNFEIFGDDFGSTTLSGNTNIWERGTPANALTQLNTTVNGWKTDLNNDLTVGTYSASLNTPNFDLSQPGTYNIQFRMSMESTTCNAPFTVQVHYSLDKGDTWSRLGNSASVDNKGTNWYNRGPAESCSISSSIVADQIGWTGMFDNDFTAYDVSSFAGNADVAFRFVLYVEAGWSNGYNVDGFMIDDLELTHSSTPLPVEMISFTAEKQEKQVLLKWVTANEVNNEGFIIEKAIGDGDFQEIGFVKGAGTVTAEQYYSFTDKNIVAGYQYYRLKQADYDGKYTYSEIKPVYFENTSLFKLSVSPNPIKDNFIISLHSTVNGPGNIYVTDISGKIINHQPMQLISGANQLQIDSQSWMSGIYFISAEHGDKKEVMKVVKY